MWGKASSAGRGSEPLPAGRQGLAERRRRSRRRSALALSILFLLLLAAAGYGLWQSPMRISSVDVYGPDASLAAYAREAMQGSYLGIIPRNSIFFFPEERIRADILSSNDDIAAVSISRNGFVSISIQASYRVPVARWCGSTALTAGGSAVPPQTTSAGEEEHCYVFDAGGVIFSAVSSTTQTVNAFKLHAPLEDGTREPLHAVILDADNIPTVFDFARQLAVFGSPVVSVAIRDGEVALHLASGTRITYLLGREQDALTALVSARENFNLADGSVDYADLRFDGKVYVKKKGASGER